ncbi:MAG TPA: FAD-dependent oxidoreductase, partial [Steroidobacteraceae bacterium]|nr:FAD-dependent oxidoreductase [Steroidobacteraceae bacterium]
MESVTSKDRLKPRRREILAGIAAAVSAAWLPPALGAGASPRVGVVGGGIVGAAIAMHLAREGAQVLLFERTAPAQGATQNSFAWVNAFVDDAHYRALRLESLNSYR